MFRTTPVAVIGFDSHNYSATEGTEAHLTVKLLSGQLGQEVVVVLDTQPVGSAMSMSCVG